MNIVKILIDIIGFGIGIIIGDTIYNKLFGDDE